MVFYVKSGKKIMYDPYQYRGKIMKNIFILIRGNSSSGKTTLAKCLQKHFGTHQCLLLQQDVLRREILHAHDTVNTPAVDLIDTLIGFGIKHYQIIILEGILRKDVYGSMLKRNCQKFGSNALVYYLDIPFKMTLAHDKQKSVSFGEDLLNDWWIENDVLSDNDQKIN